MFELGRTAVLQTTAVPLWQIPTDGSVSRAGIGMSGFFELAKVLVNATVIANNRSDGGYGVGLAKQIKRIQDGRQVYHPHHSLPLPGFARPPS